MSDYDRHELKIERRGVSAKKVIAAYSHFGSLRLAAKACGVSKDTVSNVLKRFGIAPVHHVRLSSKLALGPAKRYTTFAKWHAQHLRDEKLPSSVTAIAKLAGVSADTVKCYLYRRRKNAAALLSSLPDLRTLDIAFEDIEGNAFETKSLAEYRYVIDRFAEKAALCGRLKNEKGERTAILPSIEVFVKRIKKLT